MATFQITGPDGKKYRVTGENPEGAMRALRSMLDGQTAGEQPSVGADVLKSGGSGLARGTADLIGLPGTIGDALRSGGEWALRKGYEVATGDKPSPEGGAVERFFAGPTPEVEAQMIGGGSNPLGGANLKGAMSDATGGATDYQPKTTQGEFARTVGEFLPGAAAFGGASLPNLVKTGVIPALTSETAGQAAQEYAPGLEPYARIAGALMGGFAGSKMGKKPDILPSAKEIKQSAGYAGLKEPMKQARLSADTHKQIVGDIWAEANDFGLTTQLKSQFGGTLRDHLKRAETNGGASLYDLELLRRSLRNAAGDKLDDASQALSARLVDKLDEAVDSLSDASIAASGETGRPVVDALKEAREVYRTGKKADLIETALRKAQTQASGTENGLRIQFRRIADNQKLMRGFSEAEQKAIREVAQGNLTSNALRWLGTFGVPIDQGRNFLGSLSGGGVGAAVGGAVGGPVGATIGGFALPAIGTAAKVGAQRATESQARIVEALVKAGPKGGADLARALAEQSAGGREAILKALLQSQSAAQVPSAREYAR